MASPAAPTGTFGPQSWHVCAGSSLGRGHAWLSWKQDLGGTAGPPGLRGGATGHPCVGITAVPLKVAQFCVDKAPGAHVGEEGTPS